MGVNWIRQACEGVSRGLPWRGQLGGGGVAGCGRPGLSLADRTLEELVSKGQAGSRQRKNRRQGYSAWGLTKSAPQVGRGWAGRIRGKCGGQPGLCRGWILSQASPDGVNECINASCLLSVYKHFLNAPSHDLLQVEDQVLGVSWVLYELIEFTHSSNHYATRVWSTCCLPNPAGETSGSKITLWSLPTD